MHSRPARTRRLLLAFVALLSASCGHQVPEESARDAGASAFAAAPSAVNAPVAPSPAPAEPPPPASGPETWNAAAIDWKPFDKAMHLAKAENKPVCLVIHTSWCPHCKNYSRVFDDPRVVDRARSFEMVRLDADEEPTIAARYAPDGGYIPRTFFLAPDGTLTADIHPARPRFQFFYDEHNPAPLLASMDAALAKVDRK